MPAFFPATAFTLAIGLAQSGSLTGDSAITVPPPAKPQTMQTTTPPPHRTMQLAPVLSPVEPATPPTDAATPSMEPAAVPHGNWQLKLDPTLGSMQPAAAPPPQTPSDGADAATPPTQASPPE